MSFNLESSHNDEVNELPEVDNSNEQLTESDESAEDFEDCSLNEAQDSNVDDNNQDLVEEPQETYDDCENNAVNQIEATSEGHADDDYDDFDNCGKYQSDTGEEYISKTEADPKVAEATDKEEAPLEAEEVVAEDEVPSDTEEVTEENEAPSETEEVAEEDEAPPETEEGTDESEVPPEAEEVTEEDEDPSETEEGTDESEAPSETEEGTDESEAPPETEEGTDESEAPPEAEEVTEEDEDPSETEEVTDESEVPPEAEEVTEEDEDPSETEEVTDESEVPPEAEEVVAEDEVPSDTEEVTEEDEVPSETEEVAEEGEAPSETEEVTDESEAPPETEEGTDESEVPPEAEEIAGEDEVPPKAEEVIEEDEVSSGTEKVSDEDDSKPNDTEEIPAEAEDTSDAVDNKLESNADSDANTGGTENLNDGSDGGDALCPICGKNPCECNNETNEGGEPPCPICGKNPCVCNNETNGGDDSTEQVCPNCGKYPCVCKSLDSGEGNKKIEKLEDLSFDQINALSQTQEGREYLQHLHAEMTERVSAEQMGMTVEEYREHKQKISDYQNKTVEVPPHNPSDAEQAAMAAMNQAQLTHEAFRREYYDGADKKRLKDLNNILSSQIPEMQKNESIVAGELNTVNNQIALMYSNGEHLTNREKYAVLCQRQAALEDCTNKLRSEIAVLSGDMYDCCQQTGEKYTHMGETLRAEDQQAVLSDAREVLDKGVSNKEGIIGAFHTSEKIRYDVMPSLDAELKENTSVAMLVENDQKKYLAENHMTHEQAIRDPDSEYARNARYLGALAAERTAIEAKILEADRIQHQLTEKLPVSGEDCKVEVKDLKNGTIEVSYIWESGIKQSSRESQRHDSNTKLYYRGTERKETYTVGRDDSALYGHKYAVKYRGVGFEREDTFKRGDAKLTNKLEGGFLNGSLEQGYLRDIDTGKTKASLDAAVSVAELKDTFTTTVNGKEYTIASAEVAVAKGSVGYKADEHGVALSKPEAGAFGAKIKLGATELEHGANPFAKPDSVEDAFTKLHDGLEKKKEFEDIAKGEWGEDAQGETVIRGETPKSLEERMKDALNSNSTTVAELKQLQSEGNEKLRQLQEAQQATEKECQSRFDAVSAMPRGTDEFKKALQEHNAVQDQKMLLDEQIAAMKKQQALLEEKTNKAQESEVEEKALFGWFGRKKPEVVETPTTFGNYEVDRHGFVKGEKYDSYIKDWEGYSADRHHTELFDRAKEQMISPALVEGIRVSDSDVKNPDIFWSQHQRGGTEGSFEEIAKNIPEVRDRLAAGASLNDLMEDERLGSCAAIYFHPSNMPEVIKCGDYYEFQSNGRHRILAARNLGHDIPVRVVGERTIDTPQAGSPLEATEPVQENSIKDKFSSFFSGFFGGASFGEGTAEAVPQTPPEVSLGENGNGMEGTGETEENSLQTRLDNLSKKKFSELNEGERQELVNIAVDNLKKIYGDQIPEERYEKIKSSVRFMSGNEMVNNRYIKPDQIHSVLGSYSGRRDDITINMSADNDVKSILTTLDHEAMHMATARLEGPYTTGLKTNDANIPGMNVGMNEGLTEMYSIRNVRELNPGYVSHSYTDNVRIMQKFESVIGADTIRNAYMTNDFDAVKKAYEGKFGEGSFTEFCNKMDLMHNDYSDGKYAEGDLKRDQLLKMLDDPGTKKQQDQAGTPARTMDDASRPFYQANRESGEDTDPYDENRVSPLAQDIRKNIAQGVVFTSLQWDAIRGIKSHEEEILEQNFSLVADTPGIQAAKYTPEEITAIKAYQSWKDPEAVPPKNAFEQALSYLGVEKKNAYFGLVNNALREGTEASAKQEVKDIITNLDSAFDKSELPENMTLYRGTKGKRIPEIYNLASPEDMIGKHIQDKGFMSTSVDLRQVELRFNSTDTVIYEINAQQGDHGLYLHTGQGNDKERELLLPRGTTLVITDAKYDKSGILRLKCDVCRDPADGSDVL